jgi:ankyrin repeat protein
MTVNGLDRVGRSALHHAALRGDPDTARELLDRGADVDLRDVEGFTSLHLAAQGFHLHVARLLIAHGADVDARNKFGNTPLLVALVNSRGQAEMIALLKEAGADVNLKNHAGSSPADLARSVVNEALARIVLGDG